MAYLAGAVNKLNEQINTQYRLIPIKAAVFFFSCQVVSCFVVLGLTNNNSVIVFYIIPSFTHSSTLHFPCVRFRCTGSEKAHV